MTHRHRLWERWREDAQARDHWKRFAMSWYHVAVVALRKELYS